MGRNHRNGPLRRKAVVRAAFPQVFVDSSADFASIRLSSGVEAKSYVKNGFVFCEDKKGRVIEIQVLNLSALKDLKLKPGAA